MKGYRDLQVWQKAMDLVIDVYRATQSFPSHELYGLTSQMRRAAVSMPSNLAEGHGRNSPREFLVFIGHARGSLCELETHIEISTRLGYFGEAMAAKLAASISEIARMLNGLREWSLPAGAQ